MELFKNAPVYVQADVCCFCRRDDPLLTTIECNYSLFDVICIVSVCMGRVCQGHIVPISLIRASKNGCFCGYNKGAKRGTSCFNYDTFNILRYKSSVCG